MRFWQIVQNIKIVLQLNANKIDRKAVKKGFIARFV